MRTLVKLSLLVFTLIQAPSAFAVLIMGNEVGGVDTIVGVTSDLNALGACGNGSNQRVEECWAEGSIGDLMYSDKSEAVPLIYNDDRTLAAFRLAADPGYYVLKNAQTWVALENVDLSGWGVIDLTDPALSGFKLNLGKADQLTISHITEFKGSRKVPEASTFGLLLLGALGLALVPRLRKRG